MRLSSRRLTVWSACCISIAHGALAAGWTQDENAAYLATKLYYYHSDAFFDRSGEKQSQPDFRKAEWNLYGEYGWRDGTTLGANLFVHEVEQNGEDNLGFGDNELFVRQRLWQSGDWVVSLQPLLKLPATYREDRLPRGGREGWDAELALQAGTRFALWGRQHEAGGALGYRHRAGESVNDQWRVELKAGLGVTDRLRLIPAIYTIWATDIAQQAAFSESGDNDYDLVKAELAAEYALSPRFSLLGGVFSHVSGRNGGAGDGVFIGLSHRF